MDRNASIHILDDTIVEKIAAGEVVERPVSVCKELVENAIDADADHITVQFEDAGFSRIRVHDNGKGMTPDDLAMALTRFSTSKIGGLDDLFSIHTLGFRGEALASIAAVSRMSVTSSAQEDGSGYAVYAEGRSDSVTQPAPAAHTRGTTVEVRELFYNVPARKKFMKSARAEKMALMRFCEDIAVAFPGVHFTVIADGTIAIEAPAVATQRQRIGIIAGEGFAERLIECEENQSGLSLYLLVSPPSHARAKPRYQNLYINRRVVDNVTVRSAIREAHARFITGSHKPSFFCYLECDPRTIDVNVHPSKRTVKFEDDRAIFGFVHAAVRKHMAQALGDPQHRVSFDGDDEYQTGEQPHRGYGSDTASAMPGSDAGTVDRSSPRSEHDLQSSIFPFRLSRQPSHAASSGTQKEQDSAYAHDARGTAAPSVDKIVQARSGHGSEYNELIPCYQIHNSYILTQIKNGVMLIDQHAAHERIIYEQACEDMHRGSAESQQLLFPEVIELSAEEKQILEPALEYLVSFGFSIRAFGDRTVTVDAIPLFMKDGQVENSIREIIRFLREEHHERFLNDAARQYAAAFACGAAVKAGQKLTTEEMNALLNDLFAASNPYTCPHGRPTVIRLSLDEIAKRFLR